MALSTVPIGYEGMIHQQTKHSYTQKGPHFNPRPNVTCKCLGNGVVFALRYRTVVLPCPVCLSCLSVTLVYCGQTVGRIKMKLGETWHAGRPRPRPHCAMWGPSSPQRGTAPNFRPMSVVAKRLDGLRCHWVGR